MSRDSLDLTDYVKGRRQYLLRFHKSAHELAQGLPFTIRTVCQANVSVLPRLKENGSTVSFESSKRAVVSAGPNKSQAAGHIIGGAFDSPTVTLELASPRKEPVRAIYAAAHVASGNPPSPETKYQIEYSIDAGRSWQPLLNDWRIPRTGEEPGDFWSQSLCYGSANLPESAASSVRIRFANNGGKRYLRAEAHLVYETAGTDPVRVTFNWKDSKGGHTSDKVFSQKGTPDWHLNTASAVETKWVEFAPALE
jgi:hypothetical protein